MEPDVDVAVIGAGAAGLSAAKALHARGLRVAVLEAGSKVGGRVLADQSLAGAPRELGPEFIHGEHSNQLVELIEAGLAARPAARLVELDWPNYFYLGKEGRLVSAAQAQAMPEVAAMETAFEALGGTEAEAVPEQSLLQYLVAAGVESRVLDLADAIYANDYGAVRQPSLLALTACLWRLLLALTACLWRLLFGPSRLLLGPCRLPFPPAFGPCCLSVSGPCRTGHAAPAIAPIVHPPKPISTT